MKLRAVDIKQLLLVIVVLGFSSGWNLPAIAQANSNKELAKEVAEMRKAISQLEGKVDRIYELLYRTSALPNSGTQRNPFGVPDVLDPDGADVQQSLALAEGLGKANDENASAWAGILTVAANKSDQTSIDGEWTSRWNMGAGKRWVPPYTAKIQSIGKRTYVFFRDHQGRFLGDFKRDGQILAGRMMGIDNPSDRSVIILRIVSPERIDGIWQGREAGRLDFRREIK